MVTLSDALATSRDRATEFTRSLFAEDPWTAEQVVELINLQRNATIASVNASGQPHAAVVIAGSVRDGIYFTVHPSSVLARNLAANSRIGLSVCDPRHAVMAQGRAEAVGLAADLGPLVAELAEASTAGRFTPDGWDGSIYTVAIARIFAS